MGRLARLADKGALPVERLVERDAKAELIAARVGRLAAGLLGRHVARRADQRARVGEQRIVRLSEQGQWIIGELDAMYPGDAKVHDSGPAPGVDHHVAGLEVAMNQTTLVRSGETSAGGDIDIEDLGETAWFFGLPLAQRRAIDVLHGDECLIIEFTDLVDLDAVGVTQARHRPGFADEATAQIRVVDREQLERDLALELGVEGGEDDPHAALADLLAQDVATQLGLCAKHPREQPLFLLRDDEVLGRREPGRARVLDLDLEGLGRGLLIDAGRHAWAGSSNPRPAVSGPMHFVGDFSTRTSRGLSGPSSNQTRSRARSCSTSACPCPRA